MSNASSNLTPEQMQVFQWLNEKLCFPVFADAYLGAAQFLHDKPPGYITFVCHAGRDLMNRLATTFLNIEAGRVQYPDLTRAIHQLWTPVLNKNEVSDAQKAAVDPAKKVGISVQAFSAVEKLVAEHVAGTERSDRQDLYFFQAFLDYEDIKSVPDGFLSEWKKARTFFLGKAHLRKERFKTTAADELNDHFCFLDGLLQLAAKSAYERIKELDEILEATNV